MSVSNLGFIEWGVNPETPFSLSRSIRLTNGFAFLASATTLPYIFVFFNQSVWLGWWALSCFLCFVSTWLWNRYGRYHVAKFCLFISSYFYLFVVASTLGKEAGIHMFLIPVLFSAVLLFELKEKMSLIFIILLTLSAFLALELTHYAVFQIDLTSEERQYYYYTSLVITLFCSVIIAFFYFYLYAKQLEENQSMLETAKEIERTIHYFSTSSFGSNTIDEILWDVAKNCMGRLGFVDCVIYLLDDERQLLIQKAAYGPKNPQDLEIYQPIEIPVGKGIVGCVAETGQPLMVNDTSKDSRYIADDQDRLSEIAAPLIYDGKVIGVIDSEHPQKDFFTERHLSVLKTISSLCANKVARTLADGEREQALKIRMEAEKIKAFDELKSRLFANVSHELRTPLTLIMGTIDNHLKVETSQDWHLLKNLTDRLLRLINQILDLTKLESGHFKLKLVAGEFTAFLRMNLSLFASLASTRNISLLDNVPDEPLWLAFDRDAMEKILANLLSNAIKFTKDGSSLTLRVTYQEGLNMSISDQGEGIPEASLDKIFNRFYQIENRAGTGIGLALTKELVELHGGKISVDSKPGQGTTFTVKLPLQKVNPPFIDTENDPATPPEIADEDDKKSSHEQRNSVLLVEDNHELANFIKGQLEPEFEVWKVFDGKQAMQEALSKLPDLIISDVMMPGMDGIALCQWLKENELTSHIPVILLTARADLETKLQGFQTGADEYIVKPFHAEELRIRTLNLLAQRKKLREKYCKIVELKPNDIVITSTDEVFLKKVLAITEKNISDPDFSVEKLCREVGISRMQFHRKLGALTGQSASSFIRHQRLLRAYQLLKSGEAVSQAAYQSGFNSLSYFTKSFKEQFGFNPSEHAEKAQ